MSEDAKPKTRIIFWLEQDTGSYTPGRKEVCQFIQWMRQTSRQKDGQTDSPTLLAHSQHVWIELLEWELGEQGDQILLTEQQPAAVWVLILGGEDTSDKVKMTT